MPTSWSPLQYDAGALAPHLSRVTVQLHHAHHHRAFAAKLEACILGTRFAGASLEDVIARTVERPAYKSLHNAASQAWSHNFYFQSMRPSGGGAPTGRLGELVTQQFGGVDRFFEAFHSAASALEGSGWLWLIITGGALEICTTANAETPLARGQTPLIGIDLWEHAYLLDYQGRRGEYVQTFLASLANWDFANTNLQKTLRTSAAIAQF